MSDQEVDSVELPSIIMHSLLIRGRLTGETVRALIDSLCKKAGISKKMSPHRIRHSSITTALEHSNGNYQKVQTLNRHASLDTIKIYDDNRMRSLQQQELSNLLRDLI